MRVSLDYINDDNIQNIMENTRKFGALTNVVGVNGATEYTINTTEGAVVLIYGDNGNHFFVKDKNILPVRDIQLKSTKG